MECAPTANEDALYVATPELLSVAAPRVVDPSLNVTVPVGVGVPEAGVTVAVKVTPAPTDIEVAEVESAVVDAVATGAVPVPVRFTTCGLSEALSVKVSVADSAAVVVGANLILTVQVAFAANVAPLHVSEPIGKSAALMPPSATLLIDRLVDPELVMVNVFALLVVPWVWLPKATGEGEAENDGPEFATEKV